MDEVVRWEGVVHVGVHRVQVPAAVTVASPNRRLAASKLEPTILFVISMVAAHTWKSRTAQQKKGNGNAFPGNVKWFRPPDRKPLLGHV